MEKEEILLQPYRNKTILNTLKTEGIYGYNDGGNSTSYKNNEKSSMEAAINALTNGKDYSHGAIRWDGTDFLTKGKKHNKFKEYKKISISYQILKTYDDSISYARDSIFNDSIKNKSDFCERGTGKYYSIIATGSKGQSIFWKLGS